MWGICGDFTRNCGIEKFQNCVPDRSPSFSIPALGKWIICWLVLPVPASTVPGTRCYGKR